MGMELLECGQLSNFIQQKFKENGYITDVEASKIMQEILSAVSYIHEKGVIHRDLKTANILIQKKNNDY